ncbi:Pentatricopeptide repeat [Dillenia turbinata]|uniref:Pentatricopeptide repeat n=1 Tax=Dillenia turbinata TaxID=194707 RepID=A0AAN8ULB0_9MAGN
MVRLLIPTAKHFFPPKSSNHISNTKSQCLSILNYRSCLKPLFLIHTLLHKEEEPTVNTSKISPTFSWNKLIRVSAENGEHKKAFTVYATMQRKGIKPNNFTFPILIKSCASFLGRKEGRQIHVHTLKFGLDCNVYVENTLIHFYGSCGKIKDAKKVFDSMSVRTLVSWNAILTACVENSLFDDSIQLFVKMRDSGFDPDETTMVVSLSACSELGNLSLGKWVHSQVAVRGLIMNCQLGTALVNMYAKSGAVEYAGLVFDRMCNKNVWTWSAMILGFAQHGHAKRALELFSKMMKSSVRPNYVTFVGVLCACSHAGLVDEGYRYFHEMEHVHGIQPVMIHYGTMVDILGRAGHINEAYDFILNMPIEPDPVVWRTLLCACNLHSNEGDNKIRDEVRKRLLKLEPRRGGNLVMVANMYADEGMWDKAAKVRRVMKDGGIKKMAGESSIELDGSIHIFLSGDKSQVDYEGMYEILDGLNLHMKIHDNG